MTKAMSLVMILLLFCGILISTSKADNPYFRILDSYWGTQGNPVEVVAGDCNAQLVVSVIYSGQVQITNPKMTIDLPTGFNNVTGGSAVVSAYQGSVGYGSRIDFTFRISVDNRAEAGLHTTDAVIDWATYSSYYDTTLRQVVSQLSGTWSENITVPIILHSRPNLEFSIQPGLIVAGRSNNVTLFVNNAGQVEVRNMELTISTSSGIALVGIDNKFVAQSIAPSSTIAFNLVVFPSSTLASAMAQMTVSTSYKTAFGFSKSDTRTLTVPVRGYSEAEIVSVLVPPSSTSRFVLSGTVANTGLVTLRSMTISLEPSRYFSSLSPTFVGDVSVGAQSPYSLQLIASDVQNGTYPITLVMNYKDDFGIQTITRQTSYVDISIPKPQSKPSAQSATGLESLSGELILIFASLVFGIGIGYFLFGRRKREVVE